MYRMQTQRSDYTPWETHPAQCETREEADALADHVRQSTGHRVRVYQTSDPNLNAVRSHGGAWIR